MIYLYGKDGRISQTYSTAYGPKYILKYECNYRIERNLLVNEKLNLYVMFQNKPSLNDWVANHELVRKDVVNASTAQCVVRSYDRDRTYWSRSVIKVEIGRDYHLYYNK